MEKAVALMQADLFKAIPTDEVALIAAKTSEVWFEAGEMLEGETTSFYFIIEGEVEQIRDGVTVRRAPAGTGFGLFGLVGIGEAGVMETKFMTGTRAIALSQEAYSETVADHPAFALAFVRGIAGSIRNMTETIWTLEKKIYDLEAGETGSPSSV